MIRQSHRYLKLTNANTAFCMGEDTSSDWRPPGETQLHKQIKLSTSSGSSSIILGFGFEPLRSCHSFSHFEGAKCTQNIYMPLLRRWRKAYSLFGSSLKAQRRPHILSKTGSSMRKCQWRQFYMRIGLFHHHLDDKVEKNWKTTIHANTTSRGEPRWEVTVITNSGSAVLIRRLDEWTDFLWHSSVRGNTTWLHDRPSRKLFSG